MQLNSFRDELDYSPKHVSLTTWFTNTSIHLITNPPFHRLAGSGPPGVPPVETTVPHTKSRSVLVLVLWLRVRIFCKGPFIHFLTSHHTHTVIIMPFGSMLCHSATLLEYSKCFPLFQASYLVGKRPNFVKTKLRAVWPRTTDSWPSKWISHWSGVTFLGLDGHGMTKPVKDDDIHLLTYKRVIV